jgi:hypothetical protein
MPVVKYFASLDLGQNPSFLNGHCPRKPATHKVRPRHAGLDPAISNNASLAAMMHALGML